MRAAHRQPWPDAERLHHAILGGHVDQHMAMKEPPPFAFKQRLEQPRLADIHAVGDDQPLLLACKALVNFAVAFAENAEIGPV